MFRAHVAGRAGRLVLRVPAEGVADVGAGGRAGARHVRQRHAGGPRQDAAPVALGPGLPRRAQVRPRHRGEDGPSLVLRRYTVLPIPSPPCYLRDLCTLSGFRNEMVKRNTVSTKMSSLEIVRCLSIYLYRAYCFFNLLHKKRVVIILILKLEVPGL